MEREVAFALVRLGALLPGAVSGAFHGAPGLCVTES
jgi:hypothetical protein